ncbi:hypothetical protein V5F34_15355 [Xanthobacter autotrophicus]|uniref:hypothetical protein n=1 Tax=Xanthobacter autotrophicus TaxID=280 RepID=UPI00372ACF2C
MPPLIIDPALLAARDASRCDPAIEERHRLIMLAFVIIHHKAKLWIIGIHRQADAPPAPAGIAQEKREAPLPVRLHPENLVA